jgi:hypothetical protein
MRKADERVHQRELARVIEFEPGDPAAIGQPGRCSEFG